MSYQASHFVKVLTEERLEVPVDHLGSSQLVLRFSPAGEICDYQSTNTKIRLGSEKICRSTHPNWMLIWIRIKLFSFFPLKPNLSPIKFLFLKTVLFHLWSSGKVNCALYISSIGEIIRIKQFSIQHICMEGNL